MKEAIIACVLLGVACFTWEILVWRFVNKGEAGEHGGLFDEVKR